MKRKGVTDENEIQNETERNAKIRSQIIMSSTRNKRGKDN